MFILERVEFVLILTSYSKLLLLHISYGILSFLIDRVFYEAVRVTCNVIKYTKVLLFREAISMR